MNLMIQTSAEKQKKVPQTRREPASRNAQKEIACEFLTPEQYSEWDDLIDKSPHGTVFHYSWWLAATASEFKILGARQDRGPLLGGIPIPVERRFGLTLFHSPALTPYLGPVFDLPLADSLCDRLYLMRSCGELIARHIGSFDSLRYLAGACAPDLQGFLWAGFRVRLAYTFRFQATQSLEQISAHITRTHQQKLTKAMRLNLRITRDEGIEDLILLNAKTFGRQGLTAPYPADFLRRLWAVAQSHGNAHLYVAYTPEGKPVAGLLTVHDKRTTYQIVSGVDPEFREIPGSYLVLWNALQDTLPAGRDFDFEGSGIRGVECFYRRWGASPMPVWRIEKAGSRRGAFVQFVLNRREAAAFRSNAVG